jgi:hypothetical protein
MCRLIARATGDPLVRPLDQVCSVAKDHRASVETRTVTPEPRALCHVGKSTVGWSYESRETSSRHILEAHLADKSPP